MARKSKTEQLTPLELELMQVLWEQGPSTVQAVLQRAQKGRPLAYNTVQTMLTILHRKGRVSRETKDRAYVYSALVTQEKAGAEALRDLVNRLFGGKPQELVLNMVKTQQLTAQELSELHRMVEEDPGDHRG